MPTDNMKILLDGIPLPDGLRERGRAGIELAVQERRASQRRLRRTLAIVAAAAGLLVLYAGIANHERVWAAIRKTFQFVPGTGIVQEGEAPSASYIMKRPIVLEAGKGKITITGMLSDSEMTYITMAAEGIPRFDELQLIDERGEVRTIKRSMAVWAPDYWTASFWHKGDWGLQGNIRLLIPLSPPLETTARLEPADAYGSYVELGRTATANGLSVTAIADRVDDRARISLVSPPRDDFSIRDYGLSGVYLHGEETKLNVRDERGEPLAIETVPGMSAPQSELYFPLSDRPEARYTMTIPELSVTYREEKTVTLPATTRAALNLTLEVAGFPVTITRTERSSKDSLRLYTDFHYDERAERSLYDLSFDARGSSAKLDETTGAVVYMDVNMEPGEDKTVTLTFIRPTAVVRGPWTFEWSGEEIK